MVLLCMDMDSFQQRVVAPFMWFYDYDLRYLVIPLRSGRPDMLIGPSDRVDDDTGGNRVYTEHQPQWGQPL
jgi:hypothetical protein